MPRKPLTVFKWVVTVVALALNVFIYFYPEIMNSLGSCDWNRDWSEAENAFATAATETNQVVERATNLAKHIADHFAAYIPFTKPGKAAPDAKSPTLTDIHLLAFGDPQINGNWPLTSYIKRLDNYGNDYYLGHIYNVMSSRLNPSHIAVMGDLFSSQWISDSEFYNRTYRFAERIFKRPLEHKRNVVETHQDHQPYDWVGYMNAERELDSTDRFNSRVYNDVYDWFNQSARLPNFETPLFINLTGNHDIGYSGDATWQHMARFHHLFGQNNYVLNYNKGTPEEWRIVVLDSLTLEGPPLQQEFLNYTWSFLDHLGLQENKLFNGSTILLTHIPFYKAEAVCRDGPRHEYYITNEKEPYKIGNLRSQNHLSYETSQKILPIVFPNAKKHNLILTGHDHVGCDSWYNLQGHEWVASHEKGHSDGVLPIKEVVVRSMMGDYDGYTGIVTGHFNDISKLWEFNISYCAFAVQHWWWAAKVVTALAFFLQSAAFFFKI